MKTNVRFCPVCEEEIPEKHYVWRRNDPDRRIDFCADFTCYDQVVKHLIAAEDDARRQEKGAYLWLSTGGTHERR